MKKVVNFIKKHKLLVLFLILLIIVIIFAVKVILIFTDNDETAIYGERLNGTGSVELDISSTNDKISKKVGDAVSGVSVRRQGRIVNIILNVKDDTTREVAKDLANQAITEFSDEDRAYYDFQVFLNKTNEDTQFPVIGYKHHTKENIVWTKDR